LLKPDDNNNSIKLFEGCDSAATEANHRASTRRQHKYKVQKTIKTSKNKTKLNT
jgi:hypothetical protein